MWAVRCAGNKRSPAKQFFPLYGAKRVCRMKRVVGDIGSSTYWRMALAGCDAIRLCAEPPGAAGQTFLPDDGLPVSAPAMNRALAHAMGRPARFLALPAGVFGPAGALLGKREAVARLVGSLDVEGSLIRSRLSWTPPYSMEAGLAATVAALA